MADRLVKRIIEEEYNLEGKLIRRKVTEEHQPVQEYIIPYTKKEIYQPIWIGEPPGTSKPNPLLGWEITCGTNKPKFYSELSH